MPSATFGLTLRSEKVLMFYEGSKNRISVTTEEGLRLSLPWKIFKPHVTQHGISGRFRIVFDARGKCKTLTLL